MLTAFGPSIRKLRAFASAIDNDELSKLRSKFSGRLIVPSDKEYEAARKVIEQNPETNKYPTVVAQCKTEEDVLRCIDFGHGQGLEVAVRSGNHSILGWGTCEKGIVIDLSRIKGVAVDPDKRIVRVRAGNTAEEILAATAPHGLTPALGECGTVGAGLCLGGGLGWLSGRYGATCDDLVSARVITAAGQTLEANNRANEDLFWAIRGGGGNFGIATDFEYQLHSVSEMLAGSLYYAVKNARAVLRNFREFMASAPDEMQAECYLSTHKGGTFSVEFVYTGKLEEGERLLDGIRKLQTPIADSIKRRAYADVYEMDTENSESLLPFDWMKDIYLQELPDEAIDLILDRFANAPKNCETTFDFAHYLHGQVCRVAPGTTAFELRKSGGLHLGFWVQWKEEAQSSACSSWLNTTFEKLQPHSNGRVGANFMCTKGEAATKNVYGPNYARLAQLKRRYDPENFFHLNPNVLPK
jgi:hypothetical protein